MNRRQEWSRRLIPERASSFIFRNIPQLFWWKNTVIIRIHNRILFKKENKTTRLIWSQIAPPAHRFIFFSDNEGMKHVDASELHINLYLKRRLTKRLQCFFSIDLSENMYPGKTVLSGRIRSVYLGSDCMRNSQQQIKSCCQEKLERSEIRSHYV